MDNAAQLWWCVHAHGMPMTPMLACSVVQGCMSPILQTILETCCVRTLACASYLEGALLGMGHVHALLHACLMSCLIWRRSCSSGGRRCRRGWTPASARASCPRRRTSARATGRWGPCLCVIRLWFAIRAYGCLTSPFYLGKQQKYTNILED